MRDAAAAIGRAHRHVDHIDRMSRAHDALVEDRNVHVKLVEIDVLLVIHADQVVKSVPGDGEHRLQIALGVIETIEQVNAAGTGCGAAYAEAAGVFRVADSGEGRGLFMPHLDEAKLVLMGAQRLEETVHAVAGKSEDGIHAPLDEPFNDQI